MSRQNARQNIELFKNKQQVDEKNLSHFIQVVQTKKSSLILHLEYEWINFDKTNNSYLISPWICV